MDTEQIIKRTARQLNIDEKAARRYFDTLVTVISEELQKGNDISLTEFGEFCLKFQNGCPCDGSAKPEDAKRSIREVVFLPDAKLEDCINRW